MPITERDLRIHFASAGAVRKRKPADIAATMQTKVEWYIQIKDGPTAKWRTAGPGYATKDEADAMMAVLDEHGGGVYRVTWMSK